MALSTAGYFICRRRQCGTVVGVCQHICRRLFAAQPGGTAGTEWCVFQTDEGLYERYEYIYNRNYRFHATICKESSLAVLQNPFKRSYVTWIIHELRLVQMRGIANEAVVFHRKFAITKQMYRDRLA